MTAQTRSTLNSNADTNLADNVAQDISAADIRALIKDLADSHVNLTDDRKTLADQVITSGGTLTIAHGLGFAPTFFNFSLVNTTAEQGYSINDVYPIEAGVQKSNNSGMSITSDATNVYVTFGISANCWEIVHKSSGATANATNSRWNLRIEVGR